MRSSNPGYCSIIESVSANKSVALLNNIYKNNNNINENVNELQRTKIWKLIHLDCRCLQGIYLLDLRLPLQLLQWQDSMFYLILFTIEVVFLQRAKEDKYV